MRKYTIHTILQVPYATNCWHFGWVCICMCSLTQILQAQQINYTLEGITIYAELPKINSNQNYQWDMGDGSLLYGETIAHTYKKIGYFQVCYTLVDAEKLSPLAKRTCETINIAPEDLCDAIWEPVCGCNNETYMNACFAESYHGVYDWEDGVCPANPDPSMFPNFYVEQMRSAAVLPYAHKKTNLHLLRSKNESKQFSIACTNYSCGGYDSSLWNFGDGNVSHTRHPKHTYEKAGEYNICLSIINDTTLDAATYCKTILIN